MNVDFWRTKLAAWIHDPAEKAIVLLRDPAGHEGGTLAALRADLAPILGTEGGARENAHVKVADQQASAADRPQWPRDPADGRYAAWAQVSFAERPVLIHPLSGRDVDLRHLDVPVAEARAVSLDHFRDLIALGGGDPRMTFLALWRFGAETPARELNAIWQLLPADTRVPDHTIWNHLDLSSALAGAHQAGEPAILTLSLGPVQDFIAQARSVSDLWAGSHLVSALAGEAIRHIAATVGPDAVLVPHLRGLAAFDAWLLDEAAAAGVREAWLDRFRRCEAAWLAGATDANPLFAAAIPNRIVAIVPRQAAEAIATGAVNAARAAAARWADQAVTALFGGVDTGHAAKQVAHQLSGFPEAHWAIADWPRDVEGPAVAALRRLETDQVWPEDRLFSSTQWQVLSRSVELEGAKFYRPNAGILYPAVFGVADRTLAASKALRPFEALDQRGYRCSLCGEREWLTPDERLLDLPPGKRDLDPADPWPRQAGRMGVKAGEHLCALCGLKRAWPRLFADQVGKLIGSSVSRYVVSTHTMALATTLDRLIANSDSPDLPALRDLAGDAESTALPRLLYQRAGQVSDGVLDLCRKLPGAFDAAREKDDEASYAKLSDLLSKVARRRVEAYYALILLDGDHMGAWLTGTPFEAGETEVHTSLPFERSWHPKIRESVAGRRPGPDVLAYMQARRPASPGRHAAISQALAAFSSILAPYLVEGTCKGKVIYAGGDDLLAMVSVDDLLPAMLRLRLGYSGIALGDVEDQDLRYVAKGYAFHRGRIIQLMGEAASASIGAVIAHHQAPLGAVLRSLHEAEREAKDAGRNAFSIRVLKRAGGQVGFAAPWWLGTAPPERIAGTPFGILQRMKAALAGRSEADVGLSRRAVYLAREWLAHLPDWPGPGQDEGWREMAADRLASQFARQGGEDWPARDVVDVACEIASRRGVHPASPATTIEAMLSTAEFAARESRGGSIDLVEAP